MGRQSYLIALGSNRRSRFGPPERLLSRVFARGAAAKADELIALSRIVSSSPLGPGTRRYANAVALIESDLDPPALLAHLKAIERGHGRRRGRRWGDRVLDLDIIGWSGGIWARRDLAIPHPALRDRRFVLAPLVEIAPEWRDPVTGLRARQLLARLGQPRRRKATSSIG